MGQSKLVEYNDGLSSSQSFLSLPDTPYHPPSSIQFPQRKFGKKQIAKRSFQLSWFTKWKWLHYDEGDDVVYCHLCVTALIRKTVKWKRG